MGDLGVFEAMDNAGKLSAESAAEQGFELEKAIDRAIFRAKERFGAYLANSQDKADFSERFAQVKPEVIKVIAEVTTPTPGVIRRVGAALRPPAPVAKAPVKRARPSSAKTEVLGVGAVEKFAAHVASAARAAEEAVRLTREAAGDGKPWIPDAGERDSLKRDLDWALAADMKNLQRQAAVTKHGWTYDASTKLYTSSDPMEKFACPDCGTQQETLGFNKCGGCEKTWNTWPLLVQAASSKTGSSTYVLMAREIKMRGDQFKLAAEGNFKIAKDSDEEDKGKDDKDEDKKDDDDEKSPFPFGKKSYGPPMPGTMPGDNSGATGAPMAPEQPATPMAAAGDRDGDGDVAGGVTEDSPIDQIQDALEGAIVALKDVQMLSVNPALTATSAVKASKVAALRTSMDRFWSLHKQMNYVAGMLAKEATEAIRTVDPRVTGEAIFVQGFRAASRNEPLPAPSKDKRKDRLFLEGYVAFHKQAESYDSGASTDKNYVPTGPDETDGSNKGSFLNGTSRVPGDPENYRDAGPFESSQPAEKAFVQWMDGDNSKGEEHLNDQGESSTFLRPVSSRKPAPRGRK